MNTAARITRAPHSLEQEAMVFGRFVRRFTVEEYHRLLDTDILVGGSKVELIHGVLLEKPVPKPPHSKATHRVMRRLLPFFPEPDWFVGIQDSITLSDSEPEPDFFAAHGPEEKYADRHPEPRDLVLVVEVSHSSIDFDRGVKLRLYASSKIAQYWIIDVESRQVEVYTKPRGGKTPGFRETTVYRPGEAVPLVVDGHHLGSIPADELLP